MHILLEGAYLCLDCDSVTDSPVTCPSCGSNAMHPLASFINRPGHTCIDQPNQMCAVPECSRNQIIEASKALIQSATRADHRASDTQH